MTSPDAPVATTPRTAPPADAITEPWWDATRERRLVVQTCRACGNQQHHPRPICIACMADDFDWPDAAGTGRVHSFTVVARSPSPELEAPYVVAIVELDEGVRLLSHVVGIDPAEVVCDLDVSVDWDGLDDGRHLPVFRPTS